MAEREDLLTQFEEWLEHDLGAEVERRKREALEQAERSHAPGSRPATGSPDEPDNEET